LLSPRCGLGLAVDPRGTLLYAAGGYAGNTDYLSTAEVFDTYTGTTRALPAMSAARSGPGAAYGPDGAVYVVGGSTDGNNALAFCERIDPREGRWQSIAPLPTARGYLSAVFSADGCLYAAGGAMDQGQGEEWACDAFERFDPRAGAWTQLPALPTARANLASALVV
jgi:N-acetylneuraminic acid mutarotase